MILKHISRMLCLLISYSKFTRTYCKYDLTKTNKYSIFNSRDFIPKSRKYECTNGAQTLVVWAFSNFVENLRTTISKKSIIIL